MAENEQDLTTKTDDASSPSRFLNMLIGGNPVYIKNYIVIYTKNEYSVIDHTGKKVFSAIPNAMSFWSLCDFLGFE